MRKPKLIYYNDARHYLMYRYDPPLSRHVLQQPVDEILGTGVDTLSFGLASGATFLHDTRVSASAGARASPTTTMASCGGAPPRTSNGPSRTALTRYRWSSTARMRRTSRSSAASASTRVARASGLNAEPLYVLPPQGGAPRVHDRRRLRRSGQVHMPELRHPRGPAGAPRHHRGGLRPLWRRRDRDRRLRAHLLPPVGNREEHSPCSRSSWETFAFPPRPHRRTTGRATHAGRPRASPRGRQPLGRHGCAELDSRRTSSTS